MANSREEKFIIKLAAEYQGEEEIDELKKDLNSIQTIEASRKQQKKLYELREEFIAGKENVASLEKSLEQSFDPALEKKVLKTAASIEKMSGSLESQKRALSRAATAVQLAQKGYANFAASLGKSPTVKEAARLNRLELNLEKAKVGYTKIADKLMEAACAMATAGHGRVFQYGMSLFLHAQEGTKKLMKKRKKVTSGR